VTVLVTLSGSAIAEESSPANDAIKEAIAVLKERKAKIKNKEEQNKVQAAIDGLVEQFTKNVEAGLSQIPIPPSLTDKQIESKSAMRLLRVKEAQLNELIEEAKQDAKNDQNAIVVKKLTEKRDEVRKSIEEMRQQLRPQVERELRNIIFDIQIERRSAMILLRRQEARLNEMIEEAKQAAKDGENSIVVKKLIRKRDEVRKSIEEVRQRLRPEVEKELRDATKRDTKKPIR
jgi:hypothetical protein